jgi:tetratricopeptide (TPR) repeat protein
MTWNVASLINWGQIAAASIFVVLVSVQVMKLTRDYRVLKVAAYGTFVVLVAGIAFGKYYAHTAPKRLRPLENSEPIVALTGYTDAIRLDPSDADLYFRRGRTNINLHRYSDAIADFTRALEHSANDPTYLTFRAMAFLSLNDIESAERDLDKVEALRKGRQEPEEILALAAVASLRGRDDDAIKGYTAVLSVITDRNERCVSLLDRASVYVRKKEYKNALDDYDQAFGACGDEFREAALLGRGTLYDLLEEPELALRDYDAALGLNRNDYAVFFNRGVLLKAKGQLQSAISDFSRVIELKPDYPEAYAERAEIYFKLNQNERGEADLATANKLFRIPNMRIQGVTRLPLMPRVPISSTPDL